MRGRLLLPFLVYLLFYLPPGFSQGTGTEISTGKIIADTVINRLLAQDDSIKQPDIVLSRDQAIQLLQKSFRLQSWKSKQDPFRSAISQLVLKASNPPFDSTKYFLEGYNYNSIDISGEDLNPVEPVRLKIPDDTLLKSDTNFYAGKNDTIIFNRESGMRDSIKAAVDLLLDYLEARDSSMISFTGTGGKKYSLWLNSKSDRTIRFWLINDLNDSVTVWIGNPSRNTVGLYLEHGVSFGRPSRQGNVSEARINVEPQDKSKLVDIQKILTKSQFWKYRTEASFALNQGLVTNWVKGGENSISTALDITWYADYSNKPMLLSSNNFARIKYGLIKSGDDRVRKNIDLLETNSKLNHKAFGKFDFSGIMLFKTQGFSRLQLSE